MIKEEKKYIYDEKWIEILKGIEIKIEVIGIKMMGEGLSEVIDKRVRRKR